MVIASIHSGPSDLEHLRFGTIHTWNKNFNNFYSVTEQIFGRGTICQIWLRMAALLGDDVRVKFKNIKNYFLQQQKKYQKTPRGPFSPKSKWHLYDIASFLSDSAPDTETKLSWEMMEQCTNELNSSKHTTDPSTRQSKKKKLEEKEEEVLKNVNSYFKAKLERKSNNNYDYAESAGNLVTVTLKQLPFVEQCKLMKKVQDVLSEVCSEHLSSVQ
ncbi:uncharacterized protein LOC123518809 isoform X3 [Portunus trituberculatus]|uniref:uncharacterized protein LOC123518809 isoform X3 n=1 Tax=Portunus trituberculatus TaxID=210409 RepID=UPI001E1CD39B|nr:uncharacterized protein LOC123518809 isoform X3 [Portunus trituberculatus]